MKDFHSGKYMIDPPEGWKYGFPTRFTIREGQTFREWLTEKGYPKHLHELAEGYSRYWLASKMDGESDSCLYHEETGGEE